MSLLEMVEGKLSGATNRRGFIAGLLRVSVAVAAGLTAACTGVSADIPPICQGFDPPSYWENGTCMGDDYCEGSSSTWGCTIGPGLPQCTPAQGCTGTISSISSSSCGSGFTTGGWWDCCCDGKTIRCRDCMQGGSLVCICRAYISDC